MTDYFLLFILESAGSAVPLPPAARARILFIILVVATMGLVGLLALTVLRRMWRSRNAQTGGGTRAKPRGPRDRSAWEQAGQRATPAPDPDAPKNDTTPGAGERL